MLRSILSVILGMLVIGIIFALGLQLAAWLLPPAVSAGLLPRGWPAYVAAAAAVALTAGLAGGFATASAAARPAVHRPRVLAALYVICLALWIVSRAVPATTEVFWSALALGLLGGLGVLLGGAVARRLRRSA